MSRKEKVGIGLFAFIVVAGCVAIGLLAEQGGAAVTGIVNVVVLAVLVGVTYWYARQTRKMADEMKQQRLDAVRPELVLCQRHARRDASVDFKLVDPLKQEVDLRKRIEVHNFGVGVARDIGSRVVVDDWDGWATPETPLPPLAPEFWTVLELSSHVSAVDENRKQHGGLIPNTARIELTYRDTFGQGHVTEVYLTHDDHKGDYHYQVKSIRYEHHDRKDDNDDQGSY